MAILVSRNPSEVNQHQGQNGLEWSRNEQNRLAGSVEAAQARANLRTEIGVLQIERGDTLGAVVKGLTGSLNWAQRVDYRSQRIISNKPTVLSEANLIYPDQYVWIENGVIIVADSLPAVSFRNEVEPADPVTPERQPVETQRPVSPVEGVPNDTGLIRPIGDVEAALAEVNEIADTPIPESVVASIVRLLAALDFNRSIDFSHIGQSRSRNELMTNVIRDTGDAYFNVFTPDEVRNVESLQRTESRKLGFVHSIMADGRTMVLQVINGSPAYESGLRDGDVIERVNGGLPVNRLNPSYVGEQDLMRLEVDRNGAPMTLNVIPGDVPEVDAELLESDRRTLHVGTFSFSDQMVEDLNDSISQYNPENLIIDLRGNPGGFTDEANTLSATLSALHQSGIRIVLLVDSSSASASEIVAADAKEEGWGYIIGEETYGKHTQQIQHEVYNSGYFVIYTEGMHRRGEDVPVQPDLVVNSESALAIAKRELLVKD